MGVSKFSAKYKVNDIVYVKSSTYISDYEWAEYFKKGYPVKVTGIEFNPESGLPIYRCSSFKYPDVEWAFYEHELAGNSIEALNERASDRGKSEASNKVYLSDDSISDIFVLSMLKKHGFSVQEIIELRSNNII